jgi:hypothetical protein
MLFPSLRLKCVGSGIGLVMQTNYNKCGDKTQYEREKTRGKKQIPHKGHIGLLSDHKWNDKIGVSMDHSPLFPF